MRYHLEFADKAGQHYVLEGVKYMQKDHGFPAISDLLATTRLCIRTSPNNRPDGISQEIGIGYMKFRTSKIWLRFRIWRVSSPRSRSPAPAIRSCSCKRACASWLSLRNLSRENTIPWDSPWPRRHELMMECRRLPGAFHLWHATRPGASARARPLVSAPAPGT